MRRLGVALVGSSFMGRAHSHAWRTAPRAFALPLDVGMSVLAGRDPARTAAAAHRLGWDDWTDDWRSVLERDDVDLVDVCVPGDAHEEVAVAALAAGKHVLCEKPLATTLEGAELMASAAARAPGGALAMVGFTYRRVPALALAARLVRQGRLGEVRQVRAAYLQDWLVDPGAPLTWRLQAERAGAGALGDIGSHVVDLVQHVTGHLLVDVVADEETFVRERPLPTSSDGLAAASGGTATGPVTVDDTTSVLGRTDRGALVVAQATRVAPGRKNALRLEVDGTLGSLAFDLERLDELRLHDATAPPREAGVRTVHVTEPDHPYLEAWWPPGHSLGYDHAFVHQAKDLVEAVAAGEQPRPSFADGLQVQRVLDAAHRSAATRRWTPVGA